MSDLPEKLRGLAAQLASGPAFLLLGDTGLQRLGEAAIGYRWSGVYTSDTNRAIADAFVDDSRASSSLVAMGRSPSRSQSDLEVRYLFGATHLPESERPPVSQVQEAVARQRSNRELDRLATETVTPRGTVVVEGWAPGGRLEPHDLIPIFGLLGPGQAHIFSATALSDEPLLKEYVKSGQVVLHADSLNDVVQQLVDAGAYKSVIDTTGTASHHVIPLGDGFVDIDIHTWNQIRRSARPVDLEVLTPPIFSSEAARYQEFRNFVGATEGVPRWRGIAAGMNLSRDFESKLLEKVRRELDERELPSPLVVAGQTATGKSVALAALAMDLSRSGDVAVLHQSRRTVRPAVEDIDMFAAWAAERGAKATVLIWDGMLEPSEYEGVSRQLHARGRRVLVVGSAYKTRSDASVVVEAPAELSPAEISGIIQMLAGFGVEITSPSRGLDTSFLAFLYRTLPETEYQLRSGLANEMRAAERTMAKLARTRNEEKTVEQRVTAMQAAFLDAGIDLEDLLPPNEGLESVADQTFADRAPIQKVTTLVLVAGRHGMPVPIDLALRLLGREGFQSVRDALSSSDIIREIDDDSGEFYIGARSHLEAELLAQHEIPLTVEVEVIIEAIRSVRIVDGFVGGADEVEFLVKLLERIGPTSGQAPRYSRFFGNIKDALGQRRLEVGRIHPRLALQESNFARGDVHWRQQVQDGTVEERVSSLELNRDLLEEVLADQSTRGLIRLSLTVELASTLGAIIHEFSQAGDSRYVQGLGSRLDDVLRTVLDARAVDPGNVYPVDVLAWSTRDAVQSGALAPAERLNHLANAVATIESLDRGSLTEKQLAGLDSRGAELNRLLGNDVEVWAYLSKLILNTDPAATYFLAQFDAKDGPEGEAKALKRLREVPSATRVDWRCAQLLIDLTWKEITGFRLFFGERAPIHFSPEALATVSKLASDLDEAVLPDAYRLLFVRAIAEFAGGNFTESGQLFRQVAESTRQLSRRIYTSYVLADIDGRPATFTGRVESADMRYGQVWVNELATRVRFEPRIFSSSGEFARGQQLPPFYIGFKLSGGAVAEPRSLYRDSSARA